MIEIKTEETQKKYTVTASEFLDYIIGDSDDHAYWGESFIKELKETGKITRTVQSLFKERGELPLYILKDMNGNSMEDDDPDYFADETNIERVTLIDDLTPTIYPFSEGDDYWTVEGDKIIWSCWDEQSEELHDDDKLYFATEEEAEQWIITGEQLIMLWTQAENYLRLGRNGITLALKDLFKEKFDKLNPKQKKFIDEYLESIGG